LAALSQLSLTQIFLLSFVIVRTENFPRKTARRLLKAVKQRDLLCFRGMESIIDHYRLLTAIAEEEWEKRSWGVCGYSGVSELKSELKIYFEELLNGS
jgi:hypothetical protein